MIEADDICSVLSPVPITSTMITSTNITVEDPSPLWAIGTTYTVGQRVHLASTHRVYEATGKTGNTGKSPDLPLNQYDAAGVATYWIDAGPTNLYAMFFNNANTRTISVSAQTTNPGSISITLQPGYFNAISLLKLDGDSLDIVVKDTPGGNVIYSYSDDLEGSAPADYYEYFFDRFQPQTRFNAFDIPPYNAAEITLTITKITGDAKIGLFAIGDLRPLGAPLRGASVEPQDFSRRSSDAFGNATLIKRGNATDLVISAKMSIEDANTVLDTVKELLGTPVVVVGSRALMYEALTTFGTISGKLVYDDHGEPRLDINVLGLI